MRVYFTTPVNKNTHPSDLDDCTLCMWLLFVLFSHSSVGKQVLFIQYEDRGLEGMFSGIAASHLCVKVRGMTATVHNGKTSRIYLEKFIAQFLSSRVSKCMQNKYFKIISLILSLIHFIFLSALEFWERNHIPISFMTFQSREETIRDEVPSRNCSICWLEFAQPLKQLDKRNSLFSS